MAEFKKPATEKPDMASAKGKPEAKKMQTSSATLVPAAEVKNLELKSPMKDVRGWNVTGPGDQQIGIVDSILLDRADGKPRYLTVALADARGRLLLPIGVGTANVSAKTVTLDDLKPEVLKALPTLSQELITPEFERQVVVAVTGEKNQMYAPTRWYTRPEFDPANLFPAQSTQPAHKS
jgi:hypothetical protein